MDDYGVTGTRVDLELEIGLAPARLWELITDVSRIGDWSPECVYGAWLDDGPLPRAGARFEARNEFGNGMVTRPICVVTEVETARTFGWVVLDPDLDPARPGSIWRYDLRPGSTAERTLVRHSFEHGRGYTGLRELAERHPEQAASLLADRRQELRQNMIRSLERMEKA